jgi:signal transduction histidine kinase
MPESVFEEMKRQIGFGDEECRQLRALRPLFDAYVSSVVDKFYAELLSHPGMRAVLERDGVHVDRLRRTLAEWIIELTCGKYDARYWANRARIGRTHVRVNLPQHYMLSGMEIIREELQRLIDGAELPDHEEKSRALHKMLTLELGMMLETYKERYAAVVKEVERSRVEEKLSRTEHLAEIGQLAASLAHEIKNPLAGISGAIQIIRDGMDPDYKHREIIHEILSQINRLDAVVKDLLVYSRPVPPRLAYCNLDSVARRVMTFMCDESAVKRAKLEFVASGDNVRVQADESRIEQLILNLLLNASQASPPGGVVRLRTEADGEWVRLVVEDQGPGMDELVRQRAFEPFFTTKAKGTGLGLPICKNIVESHGGRISLHPSEGGGTRVEVEFPNAAES